MAGASKHLWPWQENFQGKEYSAYQCARYDPIAFYSDLLCSSSRYGNHFEHASSASERSHSKKRKTELKDKSSLWKLHTGHKWPGMEIASINCTQGVRGDRKGCCRIMNFHMPNKLRPTSANHNHDKQPHSGTMRRKKRISSSFFKGM